jgi:predicted ester cyclase
MTKLHPRLRGEDDMSKQTTPATTKDSVREFIQRVFNERNAKATGDYFSAVVQWDGGSTGTIQGPDAMTEFYETLFKALPDLHATTLDVVADEDTVRCRFVVSGTNERSLFGFPATGATIQWDEIDMYRLADGKIVEEWSSPDFANVPYQLGA